MTDAERKISSTSEDFDVLQNRLDKELSGGGGSSNNENGGVRGGGGGVGAGGGLGGSGLGGGGLGGGGRVVVLTEDKLDNRLKDVERRINSTVQRTEQSCSYLENDLKDYFHRELGDLRTVFLDRFDDQTFRIADVELDVGLVKDRVSNQDKRLSKMENNTSLLNRKLEDCSCSASAGGGGGSPSPGDRGDGGGRWGGGGRPTGEGASGGGSRGGSLGTGGENTEKSLEWRVVANEDQIRHFNTQLKDLSVSGDSLNNKVRNKINVTVITNESNGLL